MVAQQRWRKPSLLCNEVDTIDLLEHLVAVGENRSVQMPILIAGEEILEASARHDGDRFLNGLELKLDIWVVSWQIVQRAKHVSGLIFFSAKYQISGRFRQGQDAEENDEGENDLEGNRKAPGYLTWL